MAVYQVGQTFHEFVAKRKGKAERRSVAVFQCECGVRFITPLTRVNTGKTTSCGCVSRSRFAQWSKSKPVVVKHGMHGTPTYKSWEKMKDRCLNPKHKKFGRYGGRGITVCDEWMTFAAFFRDMGERPDGTTIDRIDVNKGYYKENCRWASKDQQSRNRTNSVYLEIDGVTKNLCDWAKVPQAASAVVIRYRMRRGWAHKEAVFGRSK